MINKTISVVVACYLDEGSVPELHERLTAVLRGLTASYEIIYVNDASPDNAEHVLLELAAKDPRLTVISHSRNFGSQNAFTSGMAQSIGDAVVLMDGDLQDPPELIREFVREWQDGHDVVYGVRARRRESLFRQAAYKLFYRLWRRLSYVQVPVDAGDFSLMDRKVVDQLLRFPERDRFLRGMRAYVGFKQKGVPYVRQARAHGRTTNSFFRNILWAKKAIFSFSYAPLEWVSALAVTVTLLAALAIVGYFLVYLFGPSPPRGTTTLLMVALFLGAIQLLGISLLGEYLSRVFEEVKQRPRYIVSRLVNDHRQTGIPPLVGPDVGAELTRTLDEAISHTSTTEAEAVAESKEG